MVTTELKQNYKPNLSETYMTNPRLPPAGRRLAVPGRPRWRRSPHPHPPSAARLHADGASAVSGRGRYSGDIAGNGSSGRRTCCGCSGGHAHNARATPTAHRCPSSDAHSSNATAEVRRTKVFQKGSWSQGPWWNRASKSRIQKGYQENCLLRL